jgi:hypothetical protein
MWRICRPALLTSKRVAIHHLTGVGPTPFRESNKNDYRDAEAIAAASAPTGDALCANQD